MSLRLRQLVLVRALWGSPHAVLLPEGDRRQVRLLHVSPLTAARTGGLRVGVVTPRSLAAVTALVTALGTAVVVLRRRYVVITVRGASMEPTLHEGDRVVVRRRALSAVCAGDIVVFSDLPVPEERAAGLRAAAGSASSEWLIKRAVAVPGDPVPRATVPALADADHDVVPAGVFAVVGDNALHSHDSRSYGYVAGDRLLGLALRKIGGAL